MSTEASEPEQALERSLAELPGHDVEPRLAAQIQRRSRALFLDRSRLASRPWLRRFSRFYEVGIEPALVLSAALLYLAWAVRWVLVAH